RMVGGLGDKLRTGYEIRVWMLLREGWMLSQDDYAALAGRSVFVIEDESLVLFNLEDMLGELGCTLVGPATRLDQADAMLEQAATADIAVLDVNIAGSPVFPFAEKLAARGVPLVLATGYGRDGLPEEWRAMTVLSKPYTFDDLAGAPLQIGRA